MKWREFGIIFMSTMVLALVFPKLSLGAAMKQVYWGEVMAEKIQRANVDGTGIQDVISTGDNHPQGLALHAPAGKLYWSQEGLDVGIGRANLDGSGQEAIVSDAADTSAIALDIPNGKLYWIGWTQFGIWRANLDGTAIEQLSNYPLVSSGGLAIDPAGGKLYFSEWNRGWVGRANLDGSNIEPLVMNLGMPSGMALDLAHGKMFWVSRRDRTIQRANLDGSYVETLITVSGTPGTVAIDSSAGKVYWTEFGIGKIQRANLDGSGVEELITGLLLPNGIALYEPPVRAVAIDIKPGSVPNTINLGSAGVVPVAVLSSSTFDATRINPATMTFTGAQVRLLGKGHKYSCHAEDVNGDGRPDYVCQFMTVDFILQPGQTTATLEGQTYEGELIRGEDSVTIVP